MRGKSSLSLLDVLSECESEFVDDRIRWLLIFNLFESERESNALEEYDDWDWFDSWDESLNWGDKPFVGYITDSSSRGEVVVIFEVVVVVVVVEGIEFGVKQQEQGDQNLDFIQQQQQLLSLSSPPPLHTHIHQSSLSFLSLSLSLLWFSELKGL